MPEHLRALIVVLALATAVFAFAKSPACALACGSADFERRRNLWFGLTLTAYLAHDYWLYIVVAAALVLFALRKEPNKLALFFFLLFALPAIPAQIPGLGLADHFFSIDYIRLLALAILLPAFLALRKERHEGFGRSAPDVLIAGYLVLNFAVLLQGNTFTNALRHGVFYAFIDVFLPYYVASRSLRTLPAFRDALMSFAIAALVLSAIGAFEFAKRWLLYASLEEALGVRWPAGDYLLRGDNLRALGTTGQPIPFGYVMAVAMGFFLYLSRVVPNRRIWTLGMLALTAGLVVSLSRGPWVGAAAMLVVFIATGPSPVLRFWNLGLLAAVLVPALLISPAGEVIVDHLPFVGTIEAHNITYRQRVLETSLQVIMQHPFFGSLDVMQLAAMQELRQGQGIIDIVNTYLGVALGSGLVGLSLFAGFFLAVVVGVSRAAASLADRQDERHLLGRALLATLLGILLVIFTVSSITVVPVVYWSVAGLGVAYARMLAAATAPSAAGVSGLRQTQMELRT